MHSFCYLASIKYANGICLKCHQLFIPQEKLDQIIVMDDIKKLHSTLCDDPNDPDFKVKLKLATITYVDYSEYSKDPKRIIKKN